VNKTSVAERSHPRSQLAGVLCGDVLLHRKQLSDFFCKEASLTCIRCSEDWDQLVSICRRLNVSIVVARQRFLEHVLGADLLQLTDYGKSIRVLALLESDTLEPAAAAKLLRLGCRGVVPERVSTKTFRKVTTAMLAGEIWAPRAVLSDLLADLLRGAAVKAHSGLTPQEARILELASQGRKNSEIGEALFISTETVRWHKRRLNRKLRNLNRVPMAKSASHTLETAAS
jgi:DNA-binding NarL/FixJ family response regulator